MTSSTAGSIDTLLRAVADAPAPPRPPMSVADVKRALAGHYSIERVLGEGGMGVVYLAREVELDRAVALKVVRPALAHDDGFRARLQQEARTAAKLAHPNVVPVHRLDAVDGIVAVVMGYVDGRSLRETLRVEGPLSVQRAFAAVREVAWALAHAHAVGVVHRDIKPDNVLVDRRTGRAVVVDFGIATVGDAASSAGTRGYMSPEQEAGEPAGFASDIYSLGVTACELVTGARPAAGQLPAGMPPAFAALCTRMIAADARARPAATEVADALTLLLEGPRVAPEIGQWLLRSRGLGMGFTILFALLALLAAADPLSSGWLVLLPIAWLFGREAVALRQLVRAGFSLGDIRAATEAWGRELEAERARPSSRVVRVLRATKSAGAGLLWLSLAFFAWAVNVEHGTIVAGNAGASPSASTAADSPAQNVWMMTSLVLFASGFVLVAFATMALGFVGVDAATPWLARRVHAVRVWLWSRAVVDRLAAWFARGVSPLASSVPLEQRLCAETTALVHGREPSLRAQVLRLVPALERAAASARAHGDRAAVAAAVRHLERIKLALEAEGDVHALDAVLAEGTAFLVPSTVTSSQATTNADGTA